MKFFNAIRKHGKELWDRAKEYRNIAAGCGLMLGALVINTPALPQGLSSFSIDLSGLVDFAETIFNSLAGAMVPVWSIALGLGILGMVTAFIMTAVKLRSK